MKFRTTFLTFFAVLLGACSLPVAKPTTMQYAAARQFDFKIPVRDQLKGRYTPFTSVASPFSKASRKASRAATWYGWQSVHDLAGNYSEGVLPTSSMITGNDGAVYGTTMMQGSAGYGTFYKVSFSGGHPSTPSPTFSTLHHFADGSVTYDGTYCQGKLAKDNSGYIYGTCAYGGNGYSDGDGVVYRLNTSTGAVTILHVFNDGSVTDDGTVPYGVVIDGSGNLYGVTFHGGNANVSGGNGTIFKLAPAGGGSYTYSVLHRFASDFSEGTSSGSPTLASDGNLYGMTTSNGANSNGTFWRYNLSTNTFTVMLDVPSGKSAIVAAASLVQIPTSFTGGSLEFWGVMTWISNASGEIFKLTPSGGGFAYTSMHQFQCGATTGGCWPSAPPVFTTNIRGADSTGALYGTTHYDGPSGSGSSYRITLAGNYFDWSTWVSFSPAGPTGNPYGGLVQASIGGVPALVGSSVYGGASSVGMIWDLWLQ